MKQLVNKFKRYLRLYYYLIKSSIMSVLVYRINTLMMGTTPIVWMLTTVAFITVIFQKGSQIGNWKYWELMFLLGVHEFIYLMSWLTFVGNLIGFTHFVRLGKFDITLLRPVNHRFFVSFNSLDLSGAFGGIFNTVFLVGLSLSKLDFQISIVRVIAFLFSLIISYLVFYLIIFSITSLSLFFVKSETFVDWFMELTDFDRYPAEIYSNWFKYFLFSFLPILFLAYVPTAIFLGRLPLYFVGIGLVVVACLYIISSILWRAGLKNYQSASS